jgi:hypothetical protein
MTDTSKPEKVKPAVDRITLEVASSKKIEGWLSQLQEGSRGLLRLTKADVVNFLIRHHPDELGRKEIQQIRQDHYDPVRHLLWITPKLRAAIQSCDAMAVQALQNEIKGIELSSALTAQDVPASQLDDSQIRPKKKRARREKSESEKSFEGPPINDLKDT